MLQTDILEREGWRRGMVYGSGWFC